MARPKGTRRILQELIGQNGEKALEVLVSIMEGRLTYKRLVRDPGPDENPASAALIPVVEVVPTIAERKDVAKFLFEHLAGKARQDIAVDYSGEVTTKTTYQQLDDESLSKLKELLKRAKGAAEDIIEGEVVGERPTLPESTPGVTTLAAIAHDSEDARQLVERIQVNHEEYLVQHLDPLIDETWVATWGVAGGTL